MVRRNERNLNVFDSDRLATVQATLAPQSPLAGMRVADANFRELQTQIAEVEDQIQKARRYYNGAVRQLNTLIELFPSNIVASQFRFIKAEYFEIEDPHSREVPKVDFGE